MGVGGSCIKCLGPLKQKLWAFANWSSSSCTCISGTDSKTSSTCHSPFLRQASVISYTVSSTHTRGFDGAYRCPPKGNTILLEPLLRVPGLPLKGRSSRLESGVGLVGGGEGSGLQCINAKCSDRPNILVTATRFRRACKMGSPSPSLHQVAWWQQPRQQSQTRM